MKTFIGDNFTPPKSNLLSDSGVKPRLEYVDLAKGICIILVVALHTLPGFNFGGLNILRMPLYFMLSGIFFKQYDSFVVFVQKKINNLILPLMLFELIYLTFKWSINRELNFVQYFSSLMGGGVNNGPLWFLEVLFIISILFYVLKHFPKYIIMPFIFVVSLTGLYIISDKELNVPYYFAECLRGLPFFFIGNTISKTPIIRRNSKDRQLIITGFVTFFMIMLVLAYWGIQYSNPVDKFEFESVLINPISYYIVSALTVISFILVCKGINWLPMISYCGRYSIIILGLHAIIQSHISTPYYWITGHSLPNAVIFILTVLISWLSIPFFRKYFPYFTAQKNLFEAIRRRWAVPDEELAVK